MLLIPAVDVLRGRPVRLLRGAYDRVTRYGDSPLDAALRWREAGATWLHVVDLDAARGDESPNGDAIRAVIERSGLRVQLGGGLRTLADVERALGWGAQRAVLGTTAARDSALLGEICRAFPGRIVAALDARGGEVAVEGWTVGTGRSVPVAAHEAEEAGASYLLFTAIERDGALEGPDITATRALVEAARVPVIASGGVGNEAHLEGLAATGADAVVVGRALYEGAVGAEAVRRYRE